MRHGAAGHSPGRGPRGPGVAGARRPARPPGAAVSPALALLLTALAVLARVPGRPPPGRTRPVGPVRLRRVRRRRPPDLAVVVTEVASRLRAGAPPAEAWAHAVDRALGPSGEPGDALVRLERRCARDPRTAGAVRTVVAADRLTEELGAPLATVLDRCAATLTEAEQARDARRVALAGPRSTARILAGLPFLGLLLGVGLGADPWGAALDGGWGTASVLLGLGLLLAGRRWTRALVGAAERPSGAGGRRAARRARLPAGSLP
ncbi:type II secretion protein F [Georgenia sp. 311]|nr:type II secretion protein F [Georgenia sp. 311]